MTRHYLEEFEAFWAAYPRRVGNPKDAARKQWMRIAHCGQLPPLEKMIAAAKAYAGYVKKENISGEFIAHTRTWLFQKRFLDWGAADAEKSGPPPIEASVPPSLRAFAEKNPLVWARWLSTCEITVTDDELKIKADSKFSADYIANNYMSPLAATCHRRVTIEAP